jgi:outer membrane biosynthesis protein TonB
MRLVVLICFLTYCLWGADVAPWMAIRVYALSYPILGLQARISGPVHLRLNFDDQGKPKDIVVLSGKPLLGDAAKENIVLWRF